MWVLSLPHGGASRTSAGLARPVLLLPPTLSPRPLLPPLPPDYRLPYTCLPPSHRPPPSLFIWLCSYRCPDRQPAGEQNTGGRPWSSLVLHTLPTRLRWSLDRCRPCLF